MINNQSKRITGGVLAGLFTGILIGYLLGISQNKSDISFLKQWAKNSGDYEDGNIFGYETGVPDNFHEKVKEKESRQKQGQK